MKRYIVRSAETGEKLAEGNALQCTRQLRFSSVSSFRSMITHCKTGANQKYTVEVTERKEDQDVQ